MTIIRDEELIDLYTKKMGSHRSYAEQNGIGFKN